VGIDPKLGKLKNNGGRTKTHGLRKGSPAIGAGSPDPEGSPSACQPSDQRGKLRSDCDIGAFEGVVKKRRR
jgi:hypothetical protein